MRKTIEDNTMLSKSIGGPGGTSTFLALTDTPASYTGSAGKVCKVNAGGTALIFDNYGDIDGGAFNEVYTYTANIDGGTFV
ncbi:MAG: hypothetical protein HY889_08180 [Deltaproteobacteria bacterium]|nr:hypothetical protein [Deltaproteobacteria bacterium]